MTAARQPLPVPEHPDDAYFESWRTAEDFDAYFNSTDDHSPFVRWMLRTGRRGPDLGPAPASLPTEPATKMVSVRMPVRLLTELNLRVGEGQRSAAIVAAVERYLPTLG